MDMKMTQSRKMRALTFTTVQFFFMLTGMYNADSNQNYTYAEYVSSHCISKFIH